MCAPNMSSATVAATSSPIYWIPINPRKPPLLALYEPILFNIAPNAMGLRGFEAGGHVQEWQMEAVR